MIKIIKGVAIIDCKFLENEICKKSGEWCDEECPKFIVKDSEINKEFERVKKI